MLLLLWHSRSTLLTCHIAVVFCFCSSLHQGLTSAFLSVAIALRTEVGIVASQTSSHHWQWFIIFQLFSLSLPILFDSDFIFCMYFYMEGFFSRKERNGLTWSVSPFLLQPLLPLWCLVSWYVPSHLQIYLISGIQLSLISEFSASLVNTHAAVTLGMDGISLISFCSHSMFFQLCFKLNQIILLWFLRDTILMQ